MIFLGTLLGSDRLSVPFSPTSIKNMNYSQLSNAEFDSLYISKSTDMEFTKDKPTEWDFNTVLYCDFEGNTFAGNLKESIESITDLIIKRRRSDQFEWITLETRSIEHTPDMSWEDSVAQMSIKGTDKTAAIGYTYDYAAVPILNGIESIYSIASANVECNGIVILDDEEIWMTALVENDIDTTAVVPNSVIETMYDKYPTIVRNTDANYETLQLTASFVPNEGLECVDVWDEDEVVLMKWNRQVYDFLRNGKPKLLKATDGRIWLVYVTTPPTDAYDADTQLRKLTFTCTEVGSAMSERDLYDAGLITATEEWWDE